MSLIPVYSHPYCPLLPPHDTCQRDHFSVPHTMHIQLLRSLWTQHVLSLVTISHYPPLIGQRNPSRVSSELSRLSPESVSPSFSVSLCPGSWWVITPPLLFSSLERETSYQWLQYPNVACSRHCSLQSCSVGLALGQTSVYPEAGHCRQGGHQGSRWGQMIILVSVFPQHPVYCDYNLMQWRLLTCQLGPSHLPVSLNVTGCWLCSVFRAWYSLLSLHTSCHNTTVRAAAF